MLQQSDPELEEYLGRKGHMFCDLGSTLLFAVITKESVNIVQKLITSGANINACDDKNWTALHFAVFYNDLELVCLLLYYGAEIRIESNTGRTPLMIAFQENNEEITTTLLKYYCEFDKIDPTNNHILDFSNNINSCEDNLLLAVSFCNGYSEVFKLIWPRIDIEKLPHLWPHPGLLSLLLENEHKFTPSEFLNCLCLIFETPNIIIYLVDEEVFLEEILYKMAREKYDGTFGIDFLYTLFSIGINIDLQCMDVTYRTCGFNQELEALIYAGNHHWVEPELQCTFILSHFILSFKIDCNTQNVYQYFYKLLGDPSVDPSPWLKHFSLPSKLKSKLVNFCNIKEIKLEIGKVTEFPSLLELGRLAVQRLIKQTHKITKPYQFHDAVKELCLPQLLKDIVLFKRPIYK